MLEEAKKWSIYMSDDTTSVRLFRGNMSPGKGL